MLSRSKFALVIVINRFTLIRWLISGQTFCPSARSRVVTADSPFVGKTLIESGIRNHYHCLVAGIEKADGTLHIPDAQHPLEEGDTLWLVGRTQDLEKVFHDAGQFYFVRTDALCREETVWCKRTRPLVLSELEVQDLDTETDWQLAEMKYQLLKG